MSKAQKQHRKVALKLIASKTEVKLAFDHMGSDMSKHDWTAVFLDNAHIWFVTYHDERQLYIVTCYNQAWNEIYGVQDVPDKYKEA